MKSIQEAMRAKELEVMKVVEDALQQKELELRQVQRNLLEALRLVNGLLESDNSAVDAALAEATSATKRLAPQPTMAAAAATKPALAWEQPTKRFP